MTYALVLATVITSTGQPATVLAARPQDDANGVGSQSDASAEAPGNGPPVAKTLGDEEEILGELAARLQKLGLQITADRKKIDAATSEAAYFMFAQRKDHRPHCGPLTAPEQGHWLDGKPVFTSKADRAAIRPVFDALIERMGYNRVCIYTASVHYGVDGHARFTLYKLGYRADDERRGKKPVVLLGDADYVLKL